MSYLNPLLAAAATTAVPKDDAGTAHGNKVYRGKDEVRTYWRDVSGPFRPQNHWLGYTPAFRMHAHAKGHTGTLYFDLWMDADRNVIGAHSFSDMTLARVHGHWLVKTIKVGKVEKL